MLRSRVGPPMLDTMRVIYAETAFNGTFSKANVYRSKAGPEVDEAWEGLGTNCGLNSMMFAQG